MIGLIYNKWIMNNFLSSAKHAMNMVISPSHALKLKQLNSHREIRNNGKIKSERGDHVDLVSASWSTSRDQTETWGHL
jgi:hypothetical protein